MRKLLLLQFLVMFALTSYAQEIILETPAGTLKTYNRVGKTYNIKTGETEDMVAKTMNVVYAEDNKTVYIQDPVSGVLTGAWIKGTINGTTITVPTGQSVYYMAEYNMYLKVCIMNKVPDGKLDFFVDETVENYTYTIDGDNLKLNNTSTDGSIILGIAGEIPGISVAWGGTGDFDVVYTPLEEVATTMPEGVTPTDYNMTASNGDSNFDGVVKVARVGNDVYFQGVYTLFPQGVIKGTIDDKGIVTFKKGQFMGTVFVFQMYLVGSMENLTGDYDKKNITDVVFKYDETANRYELQTPSMIFNDNAETLSPLDFYTSCVLTNETSNVTAFETERTAKISYYDLSGREISKPNTGVVIRKIEFDNGKVETSKIVIR